MRHELRAITLMLEAVRREIRAAGYLYNGAYHAQVTEAWQLADIAAAKAGEELQHGEQETEAGIREGRNDTSEPA